MQKQTIAILGQTIADTALQFMADKAGTSSAGIIAAIVAEPTGNAARYLVGLITAGVDNIDAIMAGQCVTADTIKAVRA